MTLHQVSPPRGPTPRISAMRASLPSLGLDEPAPAPRPPVRLAHALRRAWSKGYGAAELRADLMAGAVVGIVALPLSMALSIAVGAPPQHGLYTAIVAGAATAALGGCKFQVTGPTAAFVVILAPIVAKHGVGGLLTAGFMAGLLLVAMGLARLGNLIKYVPYPVTTGFTTGIATVIGALQLKDALGLEVPVMPEHFVEKMLALWGARSTASGYEAAVAASTLGLLLAVPRFLKRIPAPLVAIVGVSVAVAIGRWVLPGVEITTIGDRFHTVVDGVEVHGIPSALPWPSVPWTGELSFGTVRELVPAALAIAMLGAIESLLSGVVADGMTGTRHEPNAELLGLGVGNLLAPLFGGIAATGALARTATNIRAGARSPIAAITHSVVVLLAMLLFAPLVAYVPMASLAALLMLVAWNMSELPRFRRILGVAPKSDVFVLLICFILTVVFDMILAVSVGFMAAAVLFIRRMAASTESRLLLEHTDETGRPDLPEEVSLYEVNGPLFFGAAQSAMEALHASHGDTFRVLVLHLGKVSMIDATGLAALEASLDLLLARKKTIIVAGPLPRPQRIFEKAKLHARHPSLFLAPDLGAALEMAAELAGALPQSTSEPRPPLSAGSSPVIGH